MIELLPLLNLLALPVIGLLMKVTHQLATLTAIQQEHGRRLDRHDSDLGELRELRA